MFSPQALYESNLLKKCPECYFGPQLASDLTLIRKTLQSSAHTSARAQWVTERKKNEKAVKVSRQLLDSDSDSHSSLIKTLSSVKTLHHNPLQQAEPWIDG